MNETKETPLFDSDDLYGVIDMFLEYRDVHGSTEEQAKFQAVGEFVDGWNAGLELFQHNEVTNPPTGFDLVMDIRAREAELAAVRAERDKLRAALVEIRDMPFSLRFSQMFERAQTIARAALDEGGA